MTKKELERDFRLTVERLNQKLQAHPEEFELCEDFFGCMRLGLELIETWRLSWVAESEAFTRE